MWFLVGGGGDGGLVDVVELAVVGEGFAFPCFEDDFQGFLETLAAFFVGDAHDVVGAGVAAAADSELETSFANLVDGGGFFGDAEGAYEGEDLDGHADAHALGAGGDGAGDDNGGREDGAVGVEVHFAEPDGIEAHLFAQVDEVEGLAEGFFLGVAAATYEVEEYTEVHGCFS